MQRHKDQFTSSKAKAEDRMSVVTNSDGVTNWGAVEDRPPSASVYVLKLLPCLYYVVALYWLNRGA